MIDKVKSIAVPLPNKTINVSLIEAILLMHDLEEAIGRITCSYPNYDYKKYLKKDKDGKTIRTIDLSEFKY